MKPNRAPVSPPDPPRRRLRRPPPHDPPGIVNGDIESRLAELFDRAVAFDGAERAAYVEGACAGDARLRTRLLALLASHDAAGKFLGPPGDGDPTAAAAEVDQVGLQIGRYKLLELIGEGGCGVVYVAEQREPVRRRVALKLIKPGMDSKAVIARFEAERQALALMDHPHIAKVLDAGTTPLGRPFFVMELVRGLRVTEYCDRERLGTRARLELFVKICQAIQHAHQKGVIHRDIKPSNILVAVVDGEAVPKVIDFGIAKATHGALSDATIFTQFHHFLGTPAYMSPEQAELTSLDIDTRTDIYSLGVLLYELLTGRPPFDPKELIEAGLDEMRRTIREKEPPRPSTRLSTLIDTELAQVALRHGAEPPKLISTVRGDIDWIVMRCLEKNRNRRYETANGLAADIRRHIDNEPVVARPPSSLYRFQKAFKRNRAAFFASAAVVASLVAGIIGTAWMAATATSARAESDRLKVAALAAAAKAKELAEKSETTSKFLRSILIDAAQTIQNGRDPTQLLRVMSALNARIDTDLAGYPESRAELRTLMTRLVTRLGDYPAAVQSADSAFRERASYGAAEDLMESELWLLLGVARREMQQFD
jgi:eukaryotic-like serine/threonine-protein kinase